MISFSLGMYAAVMLTVQLNTRTLPPHGRYEYLMLPCASLVRALSRPAGGRAGAASVHLRAPFPSVRRFRAPCGIEGQGCPLRRLPSCMHGGGPLAQVAHLLFLSRGFQHVLGFFGADSSRGHCLSMLLLQVCHPSLS